MMKKPTDRRPRGAARARLAAVLLGSVLAGACSLDKVNPNAPSEGQVISNSEGLITLAVGLQAQYADNVNAFIRASELVTDEWGTRPVALAADQSLVNGNPDASFGVVSEQFAAGYRIARTADILVASAGSAEAGLGSGLRAGITALAKTMKAMALGNLTLQYQQLPLNAGTGALPRPRAEVQDSVLALLESARVDLLSVPDTALNGFRSRVLGSGIDLRNTIDAMLARYYLFRGRYADALAAAQRVSPNVLSQLTYPNPGINPIYNYSAVSRYTGARKSFFTEATPGDLRPAYWAIRTAGQPGLPDSVFDFRKYGARNDPFPLYLPDEMTLIQAEVYARQNNLPLARQLVNAVHTDNVAQVDEPVAGLPALSDAELATQDDILRQILYERRYELFGQGVRWEDLRRLRPYTPKRPSIEFLPYPQSECDVNPANPCG